MDKAIRKKQMCKLIMIPTRQDSDFFALNGVDQAMFLVDSS